MYGEELTRSMEVEVSVALSFVISYLYNKLPRRRVDMFGEELERAIKKKFEGHWYPEKPFKGSAFRCIRANGEKVDAVMETAAALSGLDIDEVKENLPGELSVWIDPNEVSYRIGEKGVVKLLYSNKGNQVSSAASYHSDDASLDGLDSEILSANRGFNPDAQCFRPIDSLSSSLSNLSLSPSPTANMQQSKAVGTHANFVHRSSHHNSGFTAATFAQTKFGSTKLKTQAKRPSRLSPTEFGVYLRQRGGMHMQLPGVPTYGPAVASLLPSPGSARAPNIKANSMASRDMRLDLLEHQQRLLFLQQHQSSLTSPVGMHSPIGGGSLGDLYSNYGQQQQTSSMSGLLSPSGVLPMESPSSPLHMTLSQQQQQQLQQQSSLGLGLLQASAADNGSRAPFFQPSTPSPDDNKYLLDNMAGLSQYQSIQHLLVAN